MLFELIYIILLKWYLSYSISLSMKIGLLCNNRYKWLYFSTHSNGVCHLFISSHCDISHVNTQVIGLVIDNSTKKQYNWFHLIFTYKIIYYVLAFDIHLYMLADIPVFRNKKTLPNWYKKLPANVKYHSIYGNRVLVQSVIQAPNKTHVINLTSWFS